jgi:hypothetical protein
LSRPSAIIKKLSKFLWLNLGSYFAHLWNNFFDMDAKSRWTGLEWDNEKKKQIKQIKMLNYLKPWEEIIIHKQTYASSVFQKSIITLTNFKYCLFCCFDCIFIALTNRVKNFNVEHVEECFLCSPSLFYVF